MWKIIIVVISASGDPCDVIQPPATFTTYDQCVIASAGGLVSLPWGRRAFIPCLPASVDVKVVAR